MNCWWTIAAFRFSAGTPVASFPRMKTRPRPGRSKPAIIRISVVLPERVGPSRMLKSPGGRMRFTSARWLSPPTSLPMSRNSKVISPPPTPEPVRRRGR